MAMRVDPASRSKVEIGLRSDADPFMNSYLCLDRSFFPTKRDSESSASESRYIYLENSVLCLKSVNLLCASQARIQSIPQPIAEEIEGKHGNGKCQSRKDRLVRIRSEGNRAVRNHRTPRRCRRVYTQTNEGKERLGGDVTRDG